MLSLSNVYTVQAGFSEEPRHLYDRTDLQAFALYHGMSDTRTTWQLDTDDMGDSVDEREVLSALWTTIAGLHPGAVLAGWKLGGLVLPILVRKSMRHGVPVPYMLRADLEMRYSTVHTVDLNRIYTQGGGGFMPPEFGLLQALDDWGIAVPYDANRLLALAKAQHIALTRYFA